MQAFVTLNSMKRTFLLLMITFIVPTTVFSISYDRDAVSNYADEWWNDRNSDYNDYSPNECANFVSQCLIAGGVSLSDGPGVDNKGCIPNCDNLDYNLYYYQEAEWKTVTYPSTDFPSNLTKGDVIIFVM